MSNDKQQPAKPERDRAISFVKFLKGIEIGSESGVDQWSAMNALKHSAYGHGRTTIRDAGPCLVISYKAGDIDQEIEVPKANVAQITRVPAEFLEAKLKAAGVVK